MFQAYAISSTGPGPAFARSHGVRICGPDCDVTLPVKSAKAQDRLLRRLERALAELVNA